MSRQTDDNPSPQLDAVLRWAPALAVGPVLIGAVINWTGWATDHELLTRGVSTWPQMTPWTALLVALSGVAILLQAGRPPAARLWVGWGLATLVGTIVVIFLAEYAAGIPVGIDQLWSPDEVTSRQASWPGRPSPQTAGSMLMLSMAVALTRVDRRWAARAWIAGLPLAFVVPFVAVAAYMFNAVSLTRVTPSTGMAISTALCLHMLFVAGIATRPDRAPIAWLLGRPDRWSLVRMIGVLAGLPAMTVLARLGFLQIGLNDPPAWVLAIAASTVVVGAATFYLSQHEQMHLIEREQLSRERAHAESARAEAEARYRLLAENSVDVVLHLRGSTIVWISPSVENAFGGSPQEWIGSDFLGHIHPDDVAEFVAAQQVVTESSTMVEARFRFRGTRGGYHWVDARGKPFIDADGNPDGTTGSMRIVDDQVEAERKLERLARFDTLTGLTNRAETISRLEAALERPRSHGALLGVIFCDIDNFKAINDTWGHAAGDVVLTTMAERIRDCVRAGDTVGRMGGDEIVVLLPGLHDVYQAARIAETVRLHACEPIAYRGNAIQATLSIGVTSGTAGESADAITARADTAMYPSETGRQKLGVPDLTAAASAPVRRRWLKRSPWTPFQTHSAARAFWPDIAYDRDLSLVWGSRWVGREGEAHMRVPETKRTGTCTCRCNACRNLAHCKNIGSGCRVKL